MTWLAKKKAKPQQGGSETEGLPPDVARGLVGRKNKITQTALLAKNDWFEW